MISKREAEEKVEKEIASHPQREDDRYILLKEHTIAKDWGGFVSTRHRSGTKRANYNMQ